MRLSMRSQLAGTTTEVDIGSAMATVKDSTVAIRSSRRRSPKEAALDLGLAAGQMATVFVKSTDVAIGID